MLKKITFRLLSKAIVVVVAAAVIASCSSSGPHAPIVERGTILKKPGVPETARSIKAVPRDEDGRPQDYVVNKGDTLYSIAFNYGLDYREIAELNSLQNVGMILVGQTLRLPSARSSKGDNSTPIEVPVKSQPKVAKLMYTKQAVTQIEKIQDAPEQTESVMVAKVQAKPEIKPSAGVNGIADNNGSALEWGMPTSGTIISRFSESASRKGIDIAGKLGQPIVASLAGKVVYSGEGLRGYGKLLIIKHSKAYLSAYAHNDRLLVKEGQHILKGQKIAEMGNTDTDRVSLHFEIRRYGKPVDPANYLPLENLE